MWTAVDWNHLDNTTVHANAEQFSNSQCSQYGLLNHCATPPPPPPPPSCTYARYLDAATYLTDTETDRFCTNSASDVHMHPHPLHLTHTHTHTHALQCAHMHLYIYIYIYCVYSFVASESETIGRSGKVIGSCPWPVVWIIVSSKVIPPAYSNGNKHAIWPKREHWHRNSIIDSWWHTQHGILISVVMYAWCMLVLVLIVYWLLHEQCISRFGLTMFGLL